MARIYLRYAFLYFIATNEIALNLGRRFQPENKLINKQNDVEN